MYRFWGKIYLIQLSKDKSSIYPHSLCSRDLTSEKHVTSKSTETTDHFIFSDKETGKIVQRPKTSIFKLEGVHWFPK